MIASSIHPASKVCDQQDPPDFLESFLGESSIALLLTVQGLSTSYEHTIESSLRTLLAYFTWSIDIIQNITSPSVSHLDNLTLSFPPQPSCPQCLTSTISTLVSHLDYSALISTNALLAYFIWSINIISYLWLPTGIYYHSCRIWWTTTG